MPVDVTRPVSTDPVPFVSSIAVSVLIGASSLTSVLCFYHSKHVLFQKAFYNNAGLICWSLAASRS